MKDVRIALYNNIKNHPDILNNQENRIWLTDEPITNIAKEVFGLGADSYKGDGRLVDFYVTSSFEKSPDNVLYMQQILSDFIKRNIPNQKLSLIVNTSCHWVAVTIIPSTHNKRKAYVRYHDSFGHNMNNDIREIIQNVYPDLYTSYSNEKEQFDTHSCGVFALINIAYYSAVPNSDIKHGFKWTRLNSLNSLTSLTKPNNLNSLIKSSNLNKDSRFCGLSLSLCSPKINPDFTYIL